MRTFVDKQVQEFLEESDRLALENAKIRNRLPRKGIPDQKPIINDREIPRDERD